MKRLILTLSLFGLSNFSVNAQTTWIHLNQNNTGLPQNSHLDVAGAQNGDVWIAAKTKGLVKYSNGTWTVYDNSNSLMTNNGVDGVRVSPSGAVWAKLNGGDIIRFDGTSMELFDETDLNVGTMINTFRRPVFHPSNGKVYFGHSNLYEYDGSVWSEYTPNNSSLPQDMWYDSGMGITSDGTIWYARWTTVYTFNPATGDSASYPISGISGNIVALATDASDRVWTSTEDNTELLYFDGSFWQTVSGLPMVGVRHLFVDANGNIWIAGAPGNGCAMYDPVTNTFDFHSTSTSGIASNNVTGFGQDTDGNIWITHDAGGGISVYNPSGVTVDTTGASSIAGLITGSDFAVYPNPATDRISVPRNKNVSGILISDLAGKVVLEIPQLHENKSVDISMLKRGSYLITAYTFKQNFNSIIIKQ